MAAVWPAGRHQLWKECCKGELRWLLDHTKHARPPPPVLQHCTAVWGLVQEAEALLASLAPAGTAAPEAEAGAEQGEQQNGGSAVSTEAQRPAEVLPGEASRQVAVLRERLAALRGANLAPDAVWLRAGSALLSCQEAAAALPPAGAGGTEQ